MPSDCLQITPTLAVISGQIKRLLVVRPWRVAAASGTGCVTIGVLAAVTLDSGLITRSILLILGLSHGLGSLPIVCPFAISKAFSLAAAAHRTTDLSIGTM
jgi:hypothetical protein